MGISSVGRLAWVPAEGEGEARSQEVKVAEQKTAKPKAPVIKKAEVVKTKEVITRTAEYVCSIPAQPARYIARTDVEIGGREAFTGKKDSLVTIQVVPDEAPQQTEDRFEKAAEVEQYGLIRTGKMSDCYDFKRFLPTAEMTLNIKKIGDEIKRAVEELDRAMDSTEKCHGLHCYF